MGSWGNYQSVIQLGAALNFGYGSLEAISQQPLLLLSKHHEDLLSEIRTALADEREIEGSPVKFQRYGRQASIVSAAAHSICLLNPYLSIISGAAGVVCLVYVSVYAACPLVTWQLLCMIGISYGWFCFAILGQLILRVWIISLSNHAPIVRVK